MLNFLFRGARSRTLRRASVSQQRSFVPRLEALEDRSLPSTLTVTNLADSGGGSLRGQLAAAAPGDTIDFVPSLSGTINLGSDLILDRNLTILGNLDAAGNPLVTLSRNNAPLATDLVINGGITASVFGLQLSGGESHAVSNFGTLTLDHVAVTGNRLGTYPGFPPVGNFFGTVYNTGTLAVRDSQITNNTILFGVSSNGAGIYSTGTLTVANCTVASNQGQSGGGIWIGGGTATITGSTISGNSASLYGGGIAVESGSLTVSGCTISGNSALRGGGIYEGPSGTSAVSGCTISG